MSTSISLMALMILVRWRENSKGEFAPRFCFGGLEEQVLQKEHTREELVELVVFDSEQLPIK